MSGERRWASWWPVWAVLRGLGIGVSSLAAGIGVMFAIIELVPADDSPCDSDLFCAPDLGPLILAVSAVPFVIALTGPLVARLLRVSGPWLFAAPAAWAMVLACVALGPADGQRRWPFDDVFSSVAILLIPYCLLAVWTPWQHWHHRRSVGEVQRQPGL